VRRVLVRSIVVSKSGTNEFHGNGYVYVRDDRFAAFPGLSRLDAANGLPTLAQADRVPFDREQFGGTIGGPIRKDKLFFFANYEQNNQDAVALHTPPTSPGFSGFTPNPFDEKLFTTKVDWAVNNKNSAFVRYSFTTMLSKFLSRREPESCRAMCRPRFSPPTTNWLPTRRTVSSEA